MLNIPPFDPEMKGFILDCAKAGMDVEAICDELHRQDFAWVREHEVRAVIEDSELTQ